MNHKSIKRCRVRPCIKINHNLMSYESNFVVYVESLSIVNIILIYLDLGHTATQRINQTKHSL